MRSSRSCRRQRAALSLSKGAVARRIAPTSAGTLSLSSRPDTCRIVTVPAAGLPDHPGLRIAGALGTRNRRSAASAPDAPVQPGIHRARTGLSTTLSTPGENYTPVISGTRQQGHKGAKTLQVRLNAEELDALTLLAEQRGVPVSTLARDFLLSHLAGSEDSPKALIAKIRAELDELATRVA